MPEVTVQKGETLSSIAKRELGSASRFRELKGFQGDPKTLQIGTVLSYGKTAPTAPGTPGSDGAQAGIGNQLSTRPGAPVIDGGLVTGTVPQTASDVTTRDEANTFINADQDADIADEPGIRKSSQTRAEIESSIRESVLPETDAPERPSFEESFGNIREEQGVAPLEERMGELDAYEAELRAALDAEVELQEGKPVAERVIRGRLSESEKNVRRELEKIGREKNVLSNQLKSKYGVIEMMMNLRKMDYDAAVGDYDRQFKNNLQMFDLVTGVERDQKSDEEKKKDDARANLQIYSNALKDGSLEDLTEEQKLGLRKLEMESGLPVGTIEKFRNTDPKADIVTSNRWTDASGKEYLAIVSRNENGELVTKNMLLGQGKVSTGAGDKVTVAEKNRLTKSLFNTQFQQMVGEDGYVSPETWAQARRAWTTETNQDSKAFDDAFRSYINPQHEEGGEPVGPSAYAGFEGFGPGFVSLGY